MANSIGTVLRHWELFSAPQADSVGKREWREKPSSRIRLGLRISWELLSGVSEFSCPGGCEPRELWEHPGLPGWTKLSRLVLLSNAASDEHALWFTGNHGYPLKCIRIRGPFSILIRFSAFSRVRHVVLENVSRGPYRISHMLQFS